MAFSCFKGSRSRYFCSQSQELQVDPLEYKSHHPFLHYQDLELDPRNRFNNSISSSATKIYSECSNFSNNYTKSAIDQKIPVFTRTSTMCPIDRDIWGFSSSFINRGTEMPESNFIANENVNISRAEVRNSEYLHKNSTFVIGEAMDQDDFKKVITTQNLDSDGGQRAGKRKMSESTGNSVSCSKRALFE